MMAMESGTSSADDALPAGDDALSVHRERRNTARAGAGSDDDVAGVDAGNLPVGSGNVDGAGGDDARVALDVVNSVFAEQERDAAGHAVHDLAAALHCYRIVGAEVVESEAELVGAPNVGHDFGVFQQSFGGDAPPVEANAAEGFPFDDAGFEAQLTGSDGSHIATRPAADYCYIKPCIGCHQTDQPTSLAQPANCQSRWQDWGCAYWRIIAAGLESGKLTGGRERSVTGSLPRCKMRCRRIRPSWWKFAASGKMCSLELENVQRCA